MLSVPGTARTCDHSSFSFAIDNGMGLLFLPRDSLYESSERKKKKKKKNRFGIIGQPYGTSNNTFPYLSFIIWIPFVLNKF